jgi:uncharacterized protein YecT (DUF1311 family)
LERRCIEEDACVFVWIDPVESSFTIFRLINQEMRRPMPRNRVSELILIKQRAGKYKRVPSHHDINELKKIWETRLKGVSPSDELVPIRIVTMLEVFLRHWIETFIDHGAPYVERASKLGANIKYDFAIARSLQGGSVSLGQLIAHSVPLSRLDAVCAVFEVLLGGDLFGAIAKTRDRWKERLEPLTGGKPIIANVTRVRNTLGRLFDVRNIIVHEIPENKTHEGTDVSDFLDASAQFVHAAEEEFLFLLHGNTPMTQAEMNQDAANRHAQAMAELEALCKEIELNTSSTEIHGVQCAWLAFKEAEAERITQRQLGGSIRPMVYSMAAAEITTARIQQIKDLEEHRMD